MRGWTSAELHIVMGGQAPNAHHPRQQQAATLGHTPPRHRRDLKQQQLYTPSDPPAPVVACSPLALSSAYAAATSQEPTYTTCHDKFIGTVDYIWFTPPPQQQQPTAGKGSSTSEGGSGSKDAEDGEGGQGVGSQGGPGPRYALRPLSVLLPPSLQSLKTGMPCSAWPSDHISLLADFALYDAAAQDAPLDGRP